MVGDESDAVVEKALGTVEEEESDSALENFWASPSWAQRLVAVFMDIFYTIVVCCKDCWLVIGVE